MIFIDIFQSVFLMNITGYYHSNLSSFQGIELNKKQVDEAKEQLMKSKKFFIKLEDNGNSAFHIMCNTFQNRYQILY